jgi:ankyrin repeat protein
MKYFLFKWVADLTAAMEKGQTSVPLAEAQGHDVVVSLLKRIL